MRNPNFLEKNSRGICLGIALLLATVLSWHTIAGDVLPIADGQGYAMRAFALYGFLHTGQWVAFWQLLSQPTQALLPPHDLLFFLLPQAIAGKVLYIVLQYLVAYLLLAYAILIIARMLNRTEWAPIVLLLCGINNIALIDFYTFYLDMTLLSVGLLAIAFQMKAWSKNRFSTSIIAGALLGSVFWIKPANAVIFLVVYIIAEMVYAANTLRLSDTKTERRRCLAALFSASAGKAIGFIPVAALAFLCGAGQTILQLIDQNEVSRTPASIENGGLLRLLYFPLCFSALYHVLVLGGLILAALIFCKLTPSRKEQEVRAPFPAHLFIPNLIAALILGEFFSFWMLAKPIRALLLVMPIFWFGFCWFWEKRRLRMGPLFLAAIIYACVAFSQKGFNLMGTTDRLVEDNYSLTMSSWGEMPSAWRNNGRLSQLILEVIVRDAPPSGIVAANAIEVRNDLSWRLESGSLLEGKTPPYEIRFLFDYKGEYFDQSLVGVNDLVLITFSPVQSSRTAWLQSMALLSYGNDTWCGENPIAHRIDMPVINGEAIGHEFIFHPPLTAEDVAKLNESAVFATAPHSKLHLMPAPLAGKHYSSGQARQLFRDWYVKRFGD